MGAERKPNLVLFLPDQQRADTISCCGGVSVHAPNLNKLASESVVFERAYVTHPVCTPSRSSLMTGTWPHINGCTRNN
ncbi:MAG: arylsulfatase, partial [Verrucomicrobia bacterium]